MKVSGRIVVRIVKMIWRFAARSEGLAYMLLEVWGGGVVVDGSCTGSGGLAVLR
jgi:hypothetical protein